MPHGFCTTHTKMSKVKIFHRPWISARVGSRPPSNVGLRLPDGVAMDNAWMIQPCKHIKKSPWSWQ